MGQPARHHQWLEHRKARKFAMDGHRAIKHRLQEHRQMETIGLSSPRPSALCAGWEGGNLGIAMSRDADTGKSYFLATLLAIAGHDLRQPLQMITNAHDVLARTVHSGEQREELAEA